MGTYRPKNRALISAWSLVACNPALEPLAWKSFTSLVRFPVCIYFTAIIIKVEIHLLAVSSAFRLGRRRGYCIGLNPY